jgi:hypothetical protein
LSNPLTCHTCLWQAMGAKVLNTLGPRGLQSVSCPYCTISRKSQHHIHIVYVVIHLGFMFKACTSQSHTRCQNSSGGQVNQIQDVKNQVYKSTTYKMSKIRCTSQPHTKCQKSSNGQVNHIQNVKNHQVYKSTTYKILKIIRWSSQPHTRY